MGQIAWMSVFMFVVFPIDINDNENEAIMKALDKNWDFINEQIDKTFSGINPSLIPQNYFQNFFCSFVVQTHCISTKVCLRNP